MKIAIFSDWFRGASSYGGGGEVYAINVAVMLAKYNEVTIFTNKIKDKQISFLEVLKYYGVPDKIINKIEVRFAPSIGWDYPQKIFREIHSRAYMHRRIKNYDLFINSSESTMNGLANIRRKIPSIKIVHFPWCKMKPNFFIPFLNRVYYSYQDKFEDSYDVICPNSQFTEGWVQRVWNNPKTTVLYPPVNFQLQDPCVIKYKENIILYVGRILEEKKCYELATCFAKIYKKHKDWKFILAGNFIPHEQDYITKIKNVLQDTNYEFKINLPQEELLNVYNKSKIFWSAKGYGITDDWKFEHFGMTTVEAMACGCVPVVINKGGQPEIVDETSGYTWDTLDELYERTTRIMKDDNLCNQLANAAIDRSKKFLMPAFKQNFRDIVRDYTGLEVKV